MEASIHLQPRTCLILILRKNVKNSEKEIREKKEKQAVRQTDWQTDGQTDSQLNRKT